MLIADNQSKKEKPKKKKAQLAGVNFKANLTSNKERSLSSQQWLKRQLNDIYVQAAKKEGYYSRSAYKLIEINQKYKILKPGAKIVDLGAAPGGWSQVVAKHIFKTEGARLISLDLLTVNPVENADILQGDFTDIAMVEKIKEMLGGAKVDVVLSDMAPNTIGSKSSDHIRIMNLVELAYNFAKEVLNINGVFVAKVFQGGTTGDLLAKIKKDFKYVDHFKPKATRKESNEIYLIARGFQGFND
jgi:23S rRNA (uridine2552-2'-O)-methyltransferase